MEEWAARRRSFPRPEPAHRRAVSPHCRHFSRLVCTERRLFHPGLSRPVCRSSARCGGTVRSDNRSFAVYRRTNRAFSESGSGTNPRDPARCPSGASHCESHWTRAPILFVGALQRRKNILRLVEAFETVASGWKLVLAGSSGFGAEEALQRIERSPRKGDIAVSGYVSDQDLETLYQRASVFAFPSLDEGFGMPVLDAMARGVPALTSNVSAMPEVAGDAALLVDPFDSQAIAEGLRNLTENEGLRADLAQKGLERSRAFSWEKAGSATWAVYRELLSSSA